MAQKLVVEIVGDSSSLERALGRSAKAAKRFQVGIGTIVKSAVVFDAVQAGIRGVTSAMSASVDEFVQQQQVATQTTAVLKSTGAAANVTAKQVDALAGSISNYSGIDDEAVQAGENMLLTFTKVQNQVGAGNDIFNQATSTIADLATAMNKGAAPSMDQMTAAALQVGKALNDPVRGYSRLQRIGVAFTKQQVAQIKGFTRVGDTVDAQRVILAELTREFGGSAAAMGQSIPGEINRVRESFRNLGGDLVGTLAPSLTRALETVNGFVDKLTAARTVRAKLNVVWEGVSAAAASVAKQLRDAFNRINWGQVWTRTKEIARSLLDQLEAAFAAVDWAQLGTTLGSKFAGLLAPVTAFVKSIDWQKVGKAVIDGLLIGLGGLTVALAGFFRKAFPAVVRLWLAVIKAQANLLLGVGKEVGRLLLSGLSDALDTVGRFLEKKMIELVLKIIEPFTHISGPLIGKLGAPFRAIKADLQQRLDDLAATVQKPAAATGVAIGTSLGAGITAGLKAAAPAGAEAIHDAADRTRPPPIPPVPPTPRPGATAAQRNTWFDNMIQRALGRVQDITTVRGQIARLQQISGLVTQRIAVTKDITRKLKLEDQQLEILRLIGADRVQLQQDAIDALSINVARAGLTKTMSDDVAALQAMNAKLAKQQKQLGYTADREQQIIGNLQTIKADREEIAQAAHDALSARQFRALGLGATGQELPPTIKALQKQAAEVRKALGSMADTKTRQTLAGIGRVLAGGIGNVTDEVKAKIKELLDALNPTVDPLAGLRQVSSRRLANILASGTGLGAAGRRVLGMNIAGAEIQPVHVHVHLDGREVATVVSKQQARTGRRTAKQTSGFRG